MNQRFSIVHIVLHWTMALLVTAGWLIGSQLEDMARGPGKVSWLGGHMLIGLGILALVLPRLLSRLVGPVPSYTAPARSDRERWERRLGGAAHVLLYALMILMPLTGLGAALSARAPQAVLGLFSIPNLLSSYGRRDTFETIHAVLSNVLLGTVALHVAATLYHAFIRRDDVAGRMIPWLAR